MTQIMQLINQIPEDTQDEALLAVESIITFGYYAARIRCHLMYPFWVHITINGNTVTLEVKGYSLENIHPDCFIPKLKRLIYDVDEAISQGRYVAEKPKEFGVIFPTSPPPDMDLPTWDEKTQQWYDAEY